MAYTSVIPVHHLKRALDYTLDGEKTSLEGAVAYALNRDKTEGGLFESAVGCTCETAFEDMCRIKSLWHKEKGVQGFHLVQSFAAGEVTPELAHQIGLELADRLLGNQYQAVVSTHLNTGHIHNHIVWNSVCIQTGKKYRSNAKSYVTGIRRNSDELCQKYGLSVIETANSERVSVPYAQWMAEQEGKPTWKSVIQQDIDTAIASAFTWTQFLRILEGKGYEFKLGRKYATIQPPGKERPVRLKTLGGQYTQDAIQRRILVPKPYLPAGKKRPQRMKLRAGREPARRLTGLRALYFSYLYKMGAMKRKPRYPSYAVREDIRRLDQRIEQMRFLKARHIDDRGQLADLRKEREDEIAALLKQRSRLYRAGPESPEIGAITGRIRQLRKEVKLCRKIEEQSLEMEQRMRAARQEGQRQREQEKGKKSPAQEKRR